MKTWNSIDKSNWKDGEWMNEPDKGHWIDKDSGFDCLIVRGPAGALCGYVGVPSNHDCYEKDYDNVYDIRDIDCHGGLTFSRKCSPKASESEGICHLDKDAANKDVWWLGFDCSHAGDVSPKYDRLYFDDFNETYRNFAYVKLEVEQLANQLKVPVNKEK